jgi:hypothetical protein
MSLERFRARSAVLAGLVVLTRVLDFAAGWFAIRVFGLPASGVPAPTTSSVLLDLPSRWDTGWYIGVAHGGYRWDGRADHYQNIAFFPGFPLVYRLAASLAGIGDSPVAWAWTGVVTSSLLFVVALLIVAEVGRQAFDHEAGLRAAALVAVYPFAVFFGLPYSEALFLLAAAGACWCYARRSYSAALAFGVLAGLTRPNGALVSLPLMWMHIASGRGSVQRKTSDRTGRSVPGAIAAIGPLVGVALYSTYVWTTTGDPLMWAKIQDAWGRPRQNPFTTLGAFVLQLFAASGPNPSPYQVVNGTAGLLVLGLSVPIARTMGLGHGAWVALAVVSAVAVGGLASLGRYASVLFPVMIYLGARIKGPMFWLVALMSLAAQIIVAGLFFSWRPIY